MFYLFCHIFATNYRYLSLENPTGYLFGSVGSHAKLIKNHDFADIFTYRTTKDEHLFYIQANHPDIYLEIDKDNSLVYAFKKDPTIENLFELNRDIEENSLFILHDRLCLTFNKTLNRFYLKECDVLNQAQRFKAKDTQTDEVILDFLPSIEDLKIRLTFE